jgi:hypothetical protein
MVARDPLVQSFFKMFSVTFLSGHLILDYTYESVTLINGVSEVSLYRRHWAFTHSTVSAKCATFTETLKIKVGLGKNGVVEKHSDGYERKKRKVTGFSKNKMTEYFISVYAGYQLLLVPTDKQAQKETKFM